MALKKLFGLVIIVICCLVLALFSGALLAPPALASLMTLEANVTDLQVIRNDNTTAITLTNVSSGSYISSVEVNGSAQYQNPDLTGNETHSGSNTGTSATVNYTSGFFLEKMYGQITGTNLNTTVNGSGPYGALTQTGSITETVTDTAYYSGSTANKTYHFVLPYTITYSLDNSVDQKSGCYYYSYTFTVTATFSYNGTTIGTTQTVYTFPSPGSDPYTPLSKIGPTTVTGSISSSNFNPGGGPGTFGVVYTVTETGLTAPIPPSAFLLGSGLLGLGLLGWRRKIG